MKIMNVQVVFRIVITINIKSNKNSKKNILFKGVLGQRGHSLNGKTAILHIVISGSSPDVSIIYK